MRCLFLILLLSFCSFCFSKDLSRPLQVTATMPRGVFKDWPLDTWRRRSVRVYTPETAPGWGLSEGELLVEGFYHNDNFWYAIIPKDPVETVYLQSEIFPAIVPAAHTQLRLKMKKPVRLIAPQGLILPETHLIHDVILSAEAVAVPGDRFNIFRGAFGNYALSYRVLSQQEAYYRQVYALEHRVEQYKLRVAPERMQRMLYTWLQWSHHAGLKKMYHTWFRSCTTEVYNLIDATTHGSWKRFWARQLQHLPVFPGTYTWLRGKIPFSHWRNNPIPDANVEFASFGEDETFAARRQAELERELRDDEWFKYWAKRTGKFRYPKCVRALLAVP